MIRAMFQLDRKQRQQLLDIAQFLLRLKNNEITNEDNKAIKYYGSLNRVLENQKKNSTE
ncbi:MAG: hypothetical protein F6K54_32180 [Okeania sp. SIO3B5]|uniref:hypothetical protein n=1 Tax=Okeania sp. SIO3B5 TaxID=2607811 RepID=UPI00140174BB|nr:hypothetical protein [Okeania sp. SIO3B5]NEO57325.1 hypothetical protein [Okeania sp. SIO3B5]